MEHQQQVDVEAALDPAATEKWMHRFLKSPLFSSTISVLVAVGRAVVQQLDATHEYFYWDRLLVLVGCCISLSLSAYQFHLQLRANNVNYAWPGRGWFLYYPRLPHEPHNQPRKRFSGHIMQIVGLISGFLQVISSFLSFVGLQLYGSNVTLRFSIVAFAYPIVNFLRNLYPEEVDPVYNVTIICQGVEHTCRASMSGFTIVAECHLHPHQPHAHIQAENMAIQDEQNGIGFNEQHPAEDRLQEILNMARLSQDAEGNKAEEIGQKVQEHGRGSQEEDMARLSQDAEGNKAEENGQKVQEHGRGSQEEDMAKSPQDAAGNKVLERMD